MISIKYDLEVFSERLFAVNQSITLAISGET